MSIDDEKLIAFIDGELEPAAQAEIEAALAEDAVLRDRVIAHQALRKRLSAAFDGALDEPVPSRLLAAAQKPQEAEIVSLDKRRAVRWSAREWGAMAASVAAGLFIGLGVMQARSPLLAPTEHGLAARGALARALEHQLASDDTGLVRISVSFRAQDGRYCRTFDLVQNKTAGLACRGGDGWDVAMTAAGEGDGVRMAGASPAIMAAVDAMIAGDPLDEETERQARAAGWERDGGRP